MGLGGRWVGYRVKNMKSGTVLPVQDGSWLADMVVWQNFGLDKWYTLVFFLTIILYANDDRLN